MFTSFTHFSIYDFITNIFIILIGYYIRYSSFPDDFIPYYFKEISGSNITPTLTYFEISLINYILGSILIFIIWLFIISDSRVFKLFNSYLFSIGLSILLSSILGKLIGRPKINTEELCGKGQIYQNCKEILTSKGLSEQFSSFPSFYVAESTSVSIFLIFLLFEIWENYSIFSNLIKISPLVYSFYIISIRIWNNQDHFDDILCGLFIGLISAIFSFYNFQKSIKINFHDRNNGQTESSSFPMVRYN